MSALVVCIYLWVGSAFASPSNLNEVGAGKQTILRPVLSAWLMPRGNFDDNAWLVDQITATEKTQDGAISMPSFGFSKQVLAAKLIVKAHEKSEDDRFVVYINYPLLDQVKLFVVDSNRKLRLLFHTGDQFDFENRPMRNRAFAFPIQLKPGDHKTIYFAAVSRDTLELPVNLFTLDAFEKYSQTEQYILGTYFGGVIVMAFFMLTLYVNYKDRTLIFMAIYLMCLAGVVGSVTGVASQVVFPDSPEFAKNVRIVWLAVSMMCTLLFGIDYLGTKENMPKLHWGFVVTSAGCALLPFLIVVLPFYYLIQLTLAFCVIVAVIAISSSVIMMRKRYIPAIYYSIAWGWFLFGGVANVGRAFGLLPNNFWTVYGFQWGSMVSVVCLALGIASKFNIERENRLKLEKVAFKEKQNRLKAQIIAQEEQLKSKQAESESKAKGEFLANMSHEIRTPMNGVLGLTQILKDTPLNDMQRKLLGTIETSGKTLLGVLNDILDYSKIESGKFDIEEIPVKPREVIKNTLELFRQRAEEKGITISSEVDEDVPEIIGSDPTRISQILLNLTSNALKFTNKGEIKMMCSLSGTEHIKFMVSDTGIGLGAEQQERLFKSFSQADSSTTRKYGGTGLGLYISKRLSELMGGGIGVDSEENKGANFWFTISLKTVADHNKASAGPESLSTDDLQGGDFSKLRVLVAEDNQVNQIVIKGLLKKLRITPVVVENGAECVSQVMTSVAGFNCILMDCEMPEMDGYEATARIREMKTIEQPIIIGLSANALKEQEDKAIWAGMNEYLRKPVDMEQLCEKLLIAKSKSR